MTTHHVEIRDSVDCEIYVGTHERATPAPGQARTCSQCERDTWAGTPTCMWCGHDRFATPLRWLLALACALLLLVNIPLQF